jgi:hypothetical protein
MTFREFLKSPVLSNFAAPGMNLPELPFFGSYLSHLSEKPTRRSCDLLHLSLSELTIIVD